MVDWNQYPNQRLISELGVYALPWGGAMQDLSNILAGILEKRMGALPWVPAGWLPAVRALYGQDGRVLVPARTSVAGMPRWINTSEKRAAWDQVASDIQAAIQLYTRGEIERGRKLMQDAYDNSAFWDRAYRIADALATPVKVAGGLLNPGMIRLVMIGGILVGGYILLAPMIGRVRRATRSAYHASKG